MSHVDGFSCQKSEGPRTCVERRCRGFQERIAKASHATKESEKHAKNKQDLGVTKRL